MDIYPLIGGAFACVAVFALYDRRKETPLQIIGRALFGIMAAFFAPWLWSLFPDSWNISDYRGLCCIGAVGAVLGFILSKTTIERLFTKAPELSDGIVSKVEDRFSTKSKD